MSGLLSFEECGHILWCEFELPELKKEKTLCWKVTGQKKPTNQPTNKQAEPPKQSPLGTQDRGLFSLGTQGSEEVKPFQTHWVTSWEKIQDHGNKTDTATAICFLLRKAVNGVISKVILPVREDCAADFNLMPTRFINIISYVSPTAHYDLWLLTAFFRRLKECVSNIK